MNWSLNIYSLLHPGMWTLYNKMVDKTNAHQLFWVSKALCHKLTWFADNVTLLDSVHVISGTTSWFSTTRLPSRVLRYCISSFYFLVSPQILQHNKPKSSSQTVWLRHTVPAQWGPQQQVPHHYLISLTSQHSSLVPDRSKIILTQSHSSNQDC